jgi:hypothetical protein
LLAAEMGTIEAGELQSNRQANRCQNQQRKQEELGGAFVADRL